MPQGLSHPRMTPSYSSSPKGAGRSAEKPSIQKDPLTAPLFQYLIDLYKPAIGPTPNLKTFRFLLLAVLCFAGFLRIEELLEAKLSDVKNFKDHMTIFLYPSAKTTNYGEGTLFISPQPVLAIVP